MQSVTIIAEVGVNHNGDIAMAKKLIDIAAEAGVDFVKFQTFKADTIVTKQAQKARYQKDNIVDGDDSQYNMLKKLELSHEQHLKLIDHCKKKDVKFFSTAFDVEGLEYLNELGFEQFKIPSGEITNYPYLKKLAELGKPIILSTGMADMQEIKDAIAVLLSSSLSIKDITVLHCNTDYPTPMKDVNLLAMKKIKEELKVSIGYSDHTLGVEVSVAAVALGAILIEKHITLDRTLPGPDHSASLEPNELRVLVNSIRNIEIALTGTGEKLPSSSELKNKPFARKSIVAKTIILKGEKLSHENITVKRPGNGVSAMRWEQVIGRIANKTYNVDEQIEI